MYEPRGTAAINRRISINFKNRFVNDDLRRFLLDLADLFFFTVVFLRLFGVADFLLVDARFFFAGARFFFAPKRVGAFLPERPDLEVVFLDLAAMMRFPKQQLKGQAATQAK
ncbi:MAG: hypothetical protein U9Q75_04940 [Pseudomonadota bacterium]|nr:hypothetical protein [Pseudomonadota bacterium]